MIIIQVCVGSSCHLKGSEELVGLLQDKIKQNALKDEIVLVGSFCTGKCNRVGVTLTVDDEVYPGITKETFGAFWNDTILPAVNNKRG